MAFGACRSVFPDKLAQWRPGHYQVHFIYTGRGESTFHIFPDGTSLLIDVGDSMRFQGTESEVPFLPDSSRRSGEWVARYVQRVNPKGRKVDYFHLSHYHEDHGGGERYHGMRILANTGDYWLCGLGDAMRFLEFGRVVDRAYPGFDDPLDVMSRSRDGTPRNIRAVYAALSARGTVVERFKLGAKDQFVQLNSDMARSGFEIFNICSNGRFVKKDGSVCDLYFNLVKNGATAFNENAMSCGIVVSYGNFRYFTAGDFSGTVTLADGGRMQIEDALADALDPVDVAKLTHHGCHSMSRRLVQALQARVWTACVLEQQHCTDDTMARVADEALYAGDRLLLPTFMPLNRKLTSFGRAYLPKVAKPVLQEPCHVVLDVAEGGDDYVMACFSARYESAAPVALYEFKSKSRG